MKILKSTLLFIAISSIFGLQSCVGDDDTSDPAYLGDFSELTFNGENYWVDCYNTNATEVVAGRLLFSHSASVFSWDGVNYESWEGFCPSKVNDTQDYASNWTAHQWASISPNPSNGIFLVGHSGSEIKENPVENDICSVQLSSGAYFTPRFVYVNNSSYTYYTAKNGSDFNAPFTLDDNVVLNIVGVQNGRLAGQIRCPLITNGIYLDQWMLVSLESLGVVDKVLFYVESTAQNAYGLTIPAYFCLADFAYTPSAIYK